MQAVHESVRLAELPTQFGLLTVDVGDSPSGPSLISSLDDLQLARHLFDLFAKFLQERSSLEGLRVVRHVAIVSSKSNDCSSTWDSAAHA
ncbi:hypothetical protein B1790_11790 [Mycobacterium sp. AT1]|nr:hypothetical protein B1790_11790 [Mycobacterium sp. AT1]